MKDDNEYFYINFDKRIITKQVKGKKIGKITITIIAKNGNIKTK